MAVENSLPASQKALLFYSTDRPLELTQQPVPTATPGSAIVQVLVGGVVSYSREVLTGKRPYPYPSPYIPGSGGVGRVIAVGPDATTLHPGDLVLVDIFLIARDNSDARCMQGVHQGTSEASARLVEGEWRHGTWAQYTKAPLENLYRLPDDGRSLNDWIQMNRMMIPFGGLTNDGGLDVKPGETVVIAPASGQFGGAGVEVALAMGAKVVALGRNVQSLEKLSNALKQFGARLRTVQLTGDVDADARAIGPVDCYLDISPPTAGNSTHMKSCFQALKPRGRVCLMGGIQHDISIPNAKVYRQNITITGKWMYERNAASKLIAMAEVGLLDLTKYTCNEFILEDWEKALDSAEQKSSWGQVTVIKP